MQEKRTDPTPDPQDRNGNTMIVADADGLVRESYGYDAFGTPEFRGVPTQANPRGEPLMATAVNNRFLFTGREWVHNYGFYEYRARAYHPGRGAS